MQGWGELRGWVGDMHHHRNDVPAHQQGKRADQRDGRGEGGSVMSPISHRTKSHQSTRYLCQEPPVVHQIFTPRATSPPQPSATGSGSPETKDKTPAIMRHKFPIQPPSIKRQQAITKFRLLIHKKITRTQGEDTRTQGYDTSNLATKKAKLHIQSLYFA